MILYLDYRGWVGSERERERERERGERERMGERDISTEGNHLLRYHLTVVYILVMTNLIKRYNDESWQAGRHTPNTGISSKTTLHA